MTIRRVIGGLIVAGLVMFVYKQPGQAADICRRVIDDVGLFFTRLTA